jgi:hypothetical protein
MSRQLRSIKRHMAIELTLKIGADGGRRARGTMVVIISFVTWVFFSVGVAVG